jgi:nickel/cobalt transporter (NiCoT) family protein
MSFETLPASGLLLMFLLGLRHGLDPDHIACIDGLTWRALSHSGDRHRAPWIGTLFAIGHGLLVTGIAVGVSRIARVIPVPDGVVQLFGWIPTALLLAVGTMNLRLLRRGDGAFAPQGWKLSLVPRALRQHSSPWAVVLIGVLFATVFDTATQAAAWGYVASSDGGGVLAALAAGLTFTAGMIITDTLDGRLICRLNRSTTGTTSAHQYRRAIGWLVVGISYAVALYNIGKSLVPAIELNELAFSISGFGLIAVMAVLWALASQRRLASK